MTFADARDQRISRETRCGFLVQEQALLAIFRGQMNRKRELAPTGDEVSYKRGLWPAASLVNERNFVFERPYNPEPWTQGPGPTMKFHVSGRLFRVHDPRARSGEVAVAVRSGRCALEVHVDRPAHVGPV